MAVKVRRVSGKCSGKVILLNQSLLGVCGERCCAEWRPVGLQPLPTNGFCQTSAVESNDFVDAGLRGLKIGNDKYIIR